MADNQHEHGSMDIKVQKETFEKFVNITIQSVIWIFVALIALYIING